MHSRLGRSLSHPYSWAQGAQVESCAPTGSSWPRSKAYPSQTHLFCMEAKVKTPRLMQLSDHSSHLKKERKNVAKLNIFHFKSYLHFNYKNNICFSKCWKFPQSTVKKVKFPIIT